MLTLTSFSLFKSSFTNRVASMRPRRFSNVCCDKRFTGGNDIVVAGGSICCGLLQKCQTHAWPQLMNQRKKENEVHTTWRLLHICSIQPRCYWKALGTDAHFVAMDITLNEPADHQPATAQDGAIRLLELLWWNCLLFVLSLITQQKSRSIVVPHALWLPSYCLILGLVQPPNGLKSSNEAHES